MEKNWTVEMMAEARMQLWADLKSGKVTQTDVKLWISEVEDLGLVATQQKTGWGDHELVGEWTNHRALSFSYSGRVTSDHDYRK